MTQKSTPDDRLAAAMRTTFATPITLWKARLFGQRVTAEGPEGKVVMSYYKGKHYMLKWEPTHEGQ